MSVEHTKPFNPLTAGVAQSVVHQISNLRVAGSSPVSRSKSRSSSGVERLHGKEEVAGSNPAVGSTGSHVPMAGDTPLQGECGGFDSLRVHKKNAPIGQAGLSRHTLNVKIASSNLAGSTRMLPSFNG